MSDNFDWTDEAIARLRELWDEGLSTRKIGLEMNVSKSAVVGKSHRLNLPARPSPIRRGDPAKPVAPKIERLLKAKTDNFAHIPIEKAREAAAQPVAIRPLKGRSIPCCWPSGTPGRPDFKFCAAPSVFGRPYCEAHCESGYLRVRDR